MIGTWLKPGVIITVAFDDEKLTLDLVKKTEIPQDEPISWMTFDVSRMRAIGLFGAHSVCPAPPEEHLRRIYEEMVQPCCQKPN
jgi:hypothetical protein